MPDSASRRTARLVKASTARAVMTVSGLALISCSAASRSAWKWSLPPIR